MAALRGLALELAAGGDAVGVGAAAARTDRRALGLGPAHLAEGLVGRFLAALVDRAKREGAGLSGELAVGLFATVLLVLAVSFANAPDQFPYAYAQGEKAKNYDPANEHWWLIRRYIFFEDSFAQWVMSGFTIVAAYLLWRTFRATQDMARETTRIGEAQVRAYLTIDEATLVIEQIKEKKVEWLINFTIRNSGQSPAKQVYFGIQTSETSSTGVVLPDIAPNQPVTRGIAFSQSLEELRFLTDAKVFFEKPLTVHYKDVFQGKGVPPHQEVVIYLAAINLVVGGVANLSPNWPASEGYPPY